MSVKSGGCGIHTDCEAGTVVGDDDLHPGGGDGGGGQVQVHQWYHSRACWDSKRLPNPMTGPVGSSQAV